MRAPYFTQREFKPPTNTHTESSGKAGSANFTGAFWHRVWKIKSFFATPRDQVTWLKLMHQNLYLPPHRDYPNDMKCPLCGAVTLNQQHLTDCPTIENDLWLALVDGFGSRCIFHHSSAKVEIACLSHLVSTHILQGELE